MSTPFYDLASMVVLPSGYKSGKIYAQKPLTTDGQLTFTRASTATRVNASGLIESVASGVPRLDYTNSGCPKILLEPQRSNLIPYSNDAASWNSSKSGTFTANAAVSPDGTTNAFRQVAGDSDPYAYHNLSLSTATYTFSCYLKGEGAAVGKQFSLRINANSQYFTIGSTWQRFVYSFSVSAGSFNVGFEAPEGAAVGDTIYGYGFQLEQGAYVTSVIPTSGTSVTRVADAASKTGISSLIGQTEGTLFVDTSETLYQSGGNDIWLMQSSVNDTSTAILIYYTPASGLTVFLNNGTASVFMQAPFTLNQRNKVAVAYKNGDYALALNGLIVDTDSSAIAPPSGMNQLAFVKWVGIGNAQKESVNQALVFKTRLTNAQLAELTTL